MLRLPPGGETRSLAATSDECAAVAALLHLPSVSKLSAELVIEPAAGGTISVTGEIMAGLEQVCVVSLDAFAVEVKQPVDMQFSGRPEAGGQGSRDQPDPVVDGVIDLGAIAVEALALSLDPYPRKPGAVFAHTVEENRKSSPFAALSVLKSVAKIGSKP